MTPKLNAKQSMKPIGDIHGETLTTPRPSLQLAPQRDIVAENHGSFNDYVPGRPPLGHSHTPKEPYSKLMQSWSMRWRVFQPLRDNGYINYLPNL